MRILPEPIIYQWDKWNTNKNFVKHGITTQECEDVLLVNQFLLLKDAPHSTIEDRYIIMGPNQQSNVLTLIITIRDAYVRVISARRASKKERNFYEKSFKAS